MSDEWLDINFATGHHSNCCWVAIGIAENASDVHLYINISIKMVGVDIKISNLTHGSVDNGHHNLGFTEADKHQAASRLCCHDPKPSATRSDQCCG